MKYCDTPVVVAVMVKFKMAGKRWTCQDNRAGCFLFLLVDSLWGLKHQRSVGIALLIESALIIF